MTIRASVSALMMRLFRAAARVGSSRACVLGMHWQQWHDRQPSVRFIAASQAEAVAWFGAGCAELYYKGK